MDMLNIHGRAPADFSNPILIATEDTIILGFNVTKIVSEDIMVSIKVKRDTIGQPTVESYLTKEFVLDTTTPYNPLNGRLILKKDDELYVRTHSANQADYVISYCNMDGSGMGGAGYDKRVPLITPEDANKVLGTNSDGTAFEVIEKKDVFPDYNSQTDSGKFLAIDNLGNIVWVTAPSGTVPGANPAQDNGKALAVVGGVVKWADPLEELSLGTGLFEVDDDGNLMPKSVPGMFSEINLGTGHFEFADATGIRLKSDGDYRVGSTLPESNVSDNDKILMVQDGNPEWTPYYDKTSIFDKVVRYGVNQSSPSVYGSLAWWIAQMDGADATLLIKQPIIIGADMTIPENICLKFEKGGKAVVSDTFTLTINGPIEAGLWQIFDGDGTVTGSLIGQVGSRGFEGAPNLYAQFVGEEVLDTTNGEWYKSTGFGATGYPGYWKKITN